MRRRAPAEEVFKVVFAGCVLEEVAVHRTIAAHNRDRKGCESESNSRGKARSYCSGGTIRAGYINICFIAGRAYEPVCARAQVYRDIG